jgi:hypothetical protein
MGIDYQHKKAHPPPLIETATGGQSFKEWSTENQLKKSI